MLHHVLATYRYGTSVAALYAGAGAVTVGGEALAGETDAMGIDFTYHTDITKQLYISDLTTPANNYNGTPFGKLTYTSPSIKLTRQSDGVYRYVNHNQCLQSQTFDSATWTKSDASITADATTAPDGTSTADKLVEAATNAAHLIYQNVTVTASPHQYSVYMKAAGRNFGSVSFTSGVVHAGVCFDLQNGTAGTVTGGISDYSITSVGNGWYHCSVGCTTAGGSHYIQICSHSADSSIRQTYNGDGSSGIYIWGAAFKRSPVQETAGGYTYATGYIATTTVAKYDLPYEWNVANASQGILIEEARTCNVAGNREFDGASWTKTSLTITADNTTAPDGTSTADRVNVTAANVSHELVRQVGSGHSAATSTVSVFAKKGTHRYIVVRWYSSSNNWCCAVFDLDSGGTTATQTANGATTGVVASTAMVAEANGWYRLSLTGTVTGVSIYFIIEVAGAATGNTFNTFGGLVYNAAGTETFYLWNAQPEVGAFATSPIHAPTAAVTRAIDNISLPVASFPYSTIASTVVVNFDKIGLTTNDNMFELRKDNGDRIMLYSNLTNPLGYVWQAANPEVFNLDLGTLTTNTFTKLGVALNASGFSSVQDNGTPVTQGAITMPTGITNLFIGYGTQSASALSGHMKQITYLARRATNGELQTRTT